ncbi:MAG: hypothetical protein Q8K02_12270 [Flavobacterium sp.]|nr:hypothetical protein [Flavobacterium sp.]
MKKQQVLETVHSFPEEINIESLIERLIFIEQIESAEKDIENGHVLTHEQVVESITKKWQE